MAMTQLDFPEESLESEFLDQSLSVWKGKNSPCYGLDDFKPVPLDLHTACSIGFSSIVRLIIDSRKEELDRANKGGWTPLMYASYIGHELVVLQLLEAGVSVNATNSKEQSPLSLATTCGNDKTAELLIKRGASVEARDKKGWTPLFHATYSGHQNMVQLLVSHGADINAVEHVHGLTPLMEASAAGHTITVQFFLQHGANVHAKSRTGVTALTEAAANGHTEIVNLLNRHILSTKSPLGASITEGPKAFAWLMDQLDDKSDLPLGSVNDLLAQLSDVEIGNGKHRAVKQNSADIIHHDPSHARSRYVDDNDDTAFSQSGAVTIKTSPVGLFTTVDTTAGHVAEPQSTTGCVRQLHQPVGHHPRASVDHSDTPTHIGHARQPASVPTNGHITYAASVFSDLRTFLSELGLGKYADIFCEQDVDLPMFLTLSEDDLKEIGIRLFGPRRKMMTAISRWNGTRSGPTETTLPQNDTTPSYQAVDELEKIRNQLQQERQLRAVTEACLMEDRVAWQRVSAFASDTLQHCVVVRDGLSMMSRDCVDFLRKVQHSSGDARGGYDPSTVRQLVEQLQATCADLLLTVSDIAVGMRRLTKNPP